MREDIAKRSKKMLKVLNSQGFRAPYQIIIDNTFAKAVNKIMNNIGQITSQLRSFPKFFIPKCEYEKYKPNLKQNDFTGQCEIIKCNHEGNTASCIATIIREDNRHHYILGTCDSKLIKEVFEVPNLPLLKIINSRILFELKGMEKAIKVNKGVPADKKELKRLRKLFENTDA